MAFCKNCGAELDEQDTFCPNCGAHAASGAPTTRCPLNNRPEYSTVPTVEKEPTDKLFCELAYSGLLFWLPAVAGTDHPYKNICVRQGLFAVILAALACIGLNLAQGVARFVLSGLPFAGVADALIFMAFLFFMLYLTSRCVKGALAIHRDEKPQALFSFTKGGYEE